ncbi:MAG: (d)CMP kinase [Evtepia gabavorous]
MDTGAIYRTVGLHVARQGGDCGDPQQVLPRLPELQPLLTYGADGLQHMLLAGEDVTQAIRENQVPGTPPRFPPTPAVRAFPLEMQRTWPEPMMSSWMADIGTVVLPQADLENFSHRFRGRSGPAAAAGSCRPGAQVTWRPSRRRSPSGLRADSHRSAAPPSESGGRSGGGHLPDGSGRRALRP